MGRSGRRRWWRWLVIGGLLVVGAATATVLLSGESATPPFDVADADGNGEIDATDDEFLEPARPVCSETVGTVARRAAAVESLREECPQVRGVPVALSSKTSGLGFWTISGWVHPSGEVTVMSELWDDEAGLIFRVTSLESAEIPCTRVGFERRTLRGDADACVHESPNGHVEAEWTESGRAWQFSGLSSWADEAIDRLAIVV